MAWGPPGGKSSFGIDCSGLVQVSLTSAGIGCPRDSDMQQAGLGRALDPGELSKLQRGDLIFWKGHVGLMLDSSRIVHANGYFMQVSVELLAIVRDRTLAQEAVPIRTIKRL